jgi:hypothetical protein
VYTSLAIVVGRLIFLTLAGFLIFRPAWSQKRLYPAALFLTLNVLFPLYFVRRMPQGWDTAVSAGWGWMVGFFLLGVGTLAFYAWLARRLVRRLPVEQPSQWILLFAVHNAGFIPLPIMEIFAPEAVTVYMFFYLLAFNLVFWTVIANVVQREGGAKGKLITINPPLLGIVVGLLLAITDLYEYIPELLQVPIEWAAAIALDAALVILGGALAGIPRADLRVKKEFVHFSLIRLVALPAVVFALVSLPLWSRIPLFAESPELLWGMRLVLVLQAAVPPATNSMIATRAFGTERQVHYTASGMITSYLFSAVTIPLFLAASLALFY